MATRREIKLLFYILVFMALTVSVEGLINNCSTYVATDSTKCETCATGYIPILNQTKCNVLIANCDFASNTNTSKCVTCSSGFILTYNTSLCGTSIPNCLTLNPNNT